MDLKYILAVVQWICVVFVFCRLVIPEERLSCESVLWRVSGLSLCCVCVFQAGDPRGAPEL